MAEPKRRGDSKRYRLVRLHLDELRAIEDIISRIPGRDARTEIEGSRWVVDDIDELVARETPGPIAELEIKRSAGPRYLSLDLGSQYAKLYVNDKDDLVLRGAFDHIDVILRRSQRSRVGQLLAGPVYSNAIVMGGLAATGLLLAAAVSNRPALVILGVLGAVLWAVALAIAWRPLFLGGALAYLEHRDDRPSFVARKRDELILAVFSAVLGVVGGVVGTLIVQALT